jgi:hypothetical protein
MFLLDISLLLYLFVVRENQILSIQIQIQIHKFAFMKQSDFTKIIISVRKIMPSIMLDEVPTEVIQSHFILQDRSRREDASEIATANSDRAPMPQQILVDHLTYRVRMNLDVSHYNEPPVAYNGSPLRKDGRPLPFPTLSPGHVLNNHPFMMFDNEAELNELPFPSLSRDDVLNNTDIINLNVEQTHQFILTACENEDESCARNAVKWWSTYVKFRLPGLKGVDLEDMSERGELNDAIGDVVVVECILRSIRRVRIARERKREYDKFLLDKKVSYRQYQTWYGGGDPDKHV